MYEERKEKFSFKSFFLTLLLVLLFILLMLWIFPNKWDLEKKYNNLQSTQDIDRLSILYDEIFANNVARMKDAAITYFTTERLPLKVGDSKKLTLREMYDLHLVLQMKDINGNPCDEEKSYVEMTKYEEEYRLKVNLSCGDQEDYIIVYLGCYSYCSKGICEKQAPKATSSTPTTNTPSDDKKPEDKKYTCEYVNGKYYDNNGKVVSKSDYEKACNKPDDKKYTCEYVNGKYYDNNGKVVSKSDYEKACNKPDDKKYTCEYVNGKYYDNNGKVVSKSDYEKACNKPDDKKYTCEYVNGKYYDNNGKVVSKSDYEKACNKPDDKKYTCEYVNGKYYDNNGKVVSKSDYEKACNKPEDKYLYEYKLETKDETTCTAWSSWSKNKVQASDTIKVETKVQRELTGTKKTKVQVGTKKETVVKKETEKYIKSWTTELVVVGTKRVKVGTTTKQVTEKVAAGTVEKFAGIGSGTAVPKNTSTKKYKVVSTDTRKSCSYCENETIYTWEIYNIETVYKTETKNVVEDVYRDVNVYEEKRVPVYDYRTVEKKEVVSTPVYEEREIPQYGDVTYYRSKTCTVKKGKTDIKWSSSKSDKDLLNKGYKLTGNVKKA